MAYWRYRPPNFKTASKSTDKDLADFGCMMCNELPESIHIGDEPQDSADNYQPGMPRRLKWGSMVPA